MSEPVRCQYPKCDKVIKYVAKRFSWVHVTPGADHPPVLPHVAKETA